MKENNPKNTAYSFAHLSDLHLSTPRFFDLLGNLGNKRAGGFSNWFTRRRHRHQRTLLNKLVKEIKQRCQHLVVTGDLTQLGTPSECFQAAGWLKETAAPDMLTLIPGNHDVYVKDSWDRTLGLWEKWMTGDENPDAAHPGFPFVRRRESVVFIGLCSAIPVGMGRSNGWVSPAQVEQLGRILEQTRQENLFRVVLIHHSPITGLESRRRQLVNSEELCKVIEVHGAELVLHGHNHRVLWGQVPGKLSDVPVYCASSASNQGLKKGECRPRRRSGCHLFSVTRDGNNWELESKTLYLNMDLELEEYANHRHTLPVY